MLKKIIFPLFLLLTMTTVNSAYAKNKIVDPKLRLALTEAINSTNSFDDQFHAEVWLV